MGGPQPGYDLDFKWLNSVHVNSTLVQEYAKTFKNKTLTDEYEAAWLLKAVTLIDLTTLGGDDTTSNVSRLCSKACEPIHPDLIEELGFDYNEPDCPIHTAAVCVYPTKVSTAFEALSKRNKAEIINVASVATGFPSGQYPLKTRIDEIKFAVECGAKEIDIVIDRSLVLTGKWETLYNEIREMKSACGPKVHMKAILATGELDTLKNVYKASVVAMMAGSDFIKTSTGKETVNATLPFGIVMAHAIRDFYIKYGHKVGLKPAGGIKTSKDAINWLFLIKGTLGNDWLCPDLFRFGASGLLGNIEARLYELITNQNADSVSFPMG